MTKILGVSEGSHDAAWCLIEDDEIIEAHHSERFMGIKNYKWLDKNLLPKSDIIVSHENLDNLNKRRLQFCQKERKRNVIEDTYFDHHLSHAAAGYYTSKFEDCDILIIDAIGEWETSAVYEVRNGKWLKTWSMKYPNSLGLFYSAITDYLGYKPMEEEYIVMGLASYGEPIVDLSYLLEENLHSGITHSLGNYKNEDIAASAQALYENELLNIINKYCKHDNLVFMGGCALNCTANSKIQGKSIWIMPNPGDAGSSLGAAALSYGRKLNWKGPYLGYDIKREIDPKEVAQYLVDNSYCGVANGRAEFGPRALGNRSLLADPRRAIKDTVNQIKQRQLFRPFAPAILEEFASEYFEGPMNEYMQFTAKAKHDYDSVTHVDGTARVQVVKKDCGSVIRPILEEFYNLTGVPMLLNTSLNIKGKPIVNDENDSKHFEKKYSVKVF